MKIEESTIDHIAHLARLEFEGDKKVAIGEDLDRIISFMDKLQEVDTENVEPLSHPIEGSNVFREDELRKSVEREDALKNAPESTHEYFKVPKVIKTD